jgi:hypothetical protein
MNYESINYNVLLVCYTCRQSGDFESDTYWASKKEPKNTEFKVHYIRTLPSHEIAYILTSPMTVVLLIGTCKTGFRC